MVVTTPAALKIHSNEEKKSAATAAMNCRTNNYSLQGAMEEGERYCKLFSCGYEFDDARPYCPCLMREEVQVHPGKCYYGCSAEKLD